MSRPLLIVTLVLAACSDPPPRTDASAAVRLLRPAHEAAPTPKPFIEPPVTFVRRLRTSEAAAAEVQDGPAKALCAALRLGDLARLEAALTPGFLGRLLGPSEPVDFGDPDVEVRRRGPSTDAVDAQAFIRGLRALAGPLAVVEACSFKPLRFKLEAPAKARAWSEHLLDVLGRDEEGRGVELRGVVRAESRPVEGGGWRFHRLEAIELRSVAAAAGFRDVSALVGVGLHRDALTEESVQARTNAHVLETIGGVAVVDWEGDGDDDLLAWNQRMTMQVFVNDGAGGFDKRLDPIERRLVGFFNLLVDLDGDGAPELVSTEVGGCRGGVAELPLFKRRGGTFEALPRRLVFAQPCSRMDQLEYQHLAVHDIDRDGDLDLYAAGYKNNHSKRGAHNLFQARDGQRDLLFLNEGGLRFREVAVERGIVGTSFGYAAVFFDADEDGDDDIFVANDYGRNDLWLNDGRAHFIGGGGPLTANGQSMGVTVADLDGDLDLDVYVSNMFSKAGHRIVPLVEGIVSEETYETLSSLARGNALFRREEKGRFREVAVAQGAARAGWAWGHTAFDADNDGDRDLYVLNGMTSHEDAAAPDY